MIWIRDRNGRELGPLTVAALEELVKAGRIGALASACRDGRSWKDASTFPELAPLLDGAAPPDARADRKQAKKIRQLLKDMQGRSLHEILRVPPGAPLEDLRRAFFPVAKPFHPARLPPGTAEELRDACRAVFDHVSGLMNEAERQAPPAVSNTAPTTSRRVMYQAPAIAPVSAAPARPPANPLDSPRPAAVPPSAPASAPRAEANPSPARSYRLEDFVGWESGGERIRATVKVNPGNAGIFTDHALANLAMEGVFIPSANPLPLGTMLDLRFVFERIERQVNARGRVVFENSGAVRRVVPGVGVRFTILEAEDRQLIRDYLQSIPPKDRQQLKL